MQVDDIQRKTGIIAIIDDDELFREALGSVVKAAGFLTDAFSSAEDYLYSAKRQDTMCLILDVRLPGMSGIELQRRLRDGNSQVPIIFINAHGDASLRDLVMNAGAARFLNEPVRSDTLLLEIQAALENTAKDEHPR